MEEPTNRELHTAIKNLTATMQEGFKGVHHRQDETNGKVNRNTEFRIEVTASLNLLKWLIGFFGISNIAVLIKLLS